MKYKYDIPTLLSLRHTGHIDIEKFTSQAIGNNLLRRRKANTSALSERPANRSRETSTLSSQNGTVSSTGGSNQRLPCRQPSNPPQGTLAQTDAGFARFLKEHASPKHQRVTAGGRIVPMNPVTPAPKMKLPVKKQDANDDKVSVPKTPTRSERGSKPEDTPVRLVDRDPSVGDISNVSSTSTGFAAGRTNLPNGHCNFGPQLQAPGPFPNFPSIPITPSPFLQPNVSVPFNSQQPLHPEQQQAQDYMTVLPHYAGHTFGADPLCWLPNFSQPSSSQNSSASFMSVPSNQPQMAGTGTQSDSTASSSLFGISQPFFSLSGSDSFHPYLGRVGGQLVANQVPAVTQPLLSGASQQTTRWKSLQDVRKEHEALSTQLSRLDRYMALHTWDLNPRSKRLLVEQRMGLVRELDAVRLYKEQLESELGGLKPSTLGPQKQPSTDFPMASAQFSAGDFANGQPTQVPWMSNIAANYAPPVLYSPAIASAFPPLLSVNEPFNTAFQWQAKENPFDDSVGFGDAPTQMNASYEAEMPYHEWTVNTDPDCMKRNTHALETASTETNSMLASNDEWGTPTASAPADIRRIYRKIEEAINRGDPTEGLLRELAAVTARAARANKESNGSPQPPSKRVVKSASNSKRYGSQASQDVIMNETHARSNIETNYILGMSKEIEESIQPATRTMRRLWKSEGSVPASVNNFRDVTCEVDDEEDSRISSSYGSTTNSWATIQEGDNGWSERGSEDGKTKSQEDLSRPARTHDASEVVTAARISASSASAGATNANDSPDWSGHDTTVHKQRNFALSSSPANITGHKVPNGTKQGYPRFLTQCLNSTAAVAVSQNVNAHAFLPPFDGAGEPPSWGQSIQGPDDYHVRGYRENDASEHLHREKNLRYIKKERDKPSPAVLREFFRRIQEEERNMIHKYQVQNPNALSLD